MSRLGTPGETLRALWRKPLSTLHRLCGETPVVAVRFRSRSGGSVSHAFRRWTIVPQDLPAIHGELDAPSWCATNPAAVRFMMGRYVRVGVDR